MRRNARILITIAIITVICGTVLGVEKINLNNFERGSENILGLSLGLDLQRGSHLIYQALNPETNLPEEITSDQMEALSKTIERRINSSGLGEPIIQIIGEDRLLVQLPGIKDPGRAKSLIGETARLEFKHRTTDVPPKPLTNIVAEDLISITADAISTDKTLKSDDNPDSENTTEYSEGVVFEFSEMGAIKFNEVVADLQLSMVNAINSAELGQNPPAPARLGVNIEGAEPLRFEANGLQIVRLEQKDGEGNKFVIALPANPDGTSSLSIEEAKAKLGTSPTVNFELSEGHIDEDIGLSGDDLDSAYPSQHQSSGVPIVNIEFNERGTREFGELTTNIYAKQQSTGLRDQIAIILDGNELIAPVVNSPITQGTAIIQ